MRALVIDDEPQVRQFLSFVLGAEGWQVSEAENAERAFLLLNQQRWELVFCDVLLGGEDGFAVLRRFAEEQSDAQVVLMTGHGSAADALDAVTQGAYDYLIKPFSIPQVQELSRSVRRRLEGHARALSQEDAAAATQPAARSGVELVGRSHAFVEVIKMVGRIAATRLPVLITGESGTGKEVVARAIHQRSARSSGPFIAVNCGAFPAELIESELFGHVRGAFTGADRDRAGLFEEADGGTVFLDEVTETTPAFQVKLLRALQEGEVRRVGSNRTVRVDVRVIAATNRRAEEEVSAGRFRQDLFYRLNTISLHLPPLRERQEDILPLVNYFARQARETASPTLHFTTEALRILKDYHWPGNIRELENVVMRAAALCDRVVRPEDLPEKMRASAIAAGDEERAPRPEALREAADPEKWLTLSEMEARYLERVLKHTKGNKNAASRLLDINRKTIDRMIKRHHLSAAGENLFAAHLRRAEQVAS